MKSNHHFLFCEASESHSLLLISVYASFSSGSQQGCDNNPCFAQTFPSRQLIRPIEGVDLLFQMKEYLGGDQSHAVVTQMLLDQGFPKHTFLPCHSSISI